MKKLSHSKTVANTLYTPTTLLFNSARECGVYVGREAPNVHTTLTKKWVIEEDVMALRMFVNPNLVLKYAAQFGKGELYQLALDWGATNTSWGLYGAARSGNIHIFNVLLNVVGEECSEYGMGSIAERALKYAARSGSVEMFSYVLDWAESEMKETFQYCYNGADYAERLNSQLSVNLISALKKASKAGSLLIVRQCMEYIEKLVYDRILSHRDNDGLFGRGLFMLRMRLEGAMVMYHAALNGGVLLVDCILGFIKRINDIEKRYNRRPCPIAYDRFYGQIMIAYSISKNRELLSYLKAIGYQYDSEPSSFERMYAMSRIKLVNIQDGEKNTYCLPRIYIEEYEEAVRRHCDDVFLIGATRKGYYLALREYGHRKLSTSLAKDLLLACAHSGDAKAFEVISSDIGKLRKIGRRFIQKIIKEIARSGHTHIIFYVEWWLREKIPEKPRLLYLALKNIQHYLIEENRELVEMRDIMLGGR